MPAVESRLAQLQSFGQSPWFDYISRELIARGGLKRMVDQDGLGGVTSNPSIFEKAIGSGSELRRGDPRARARGSDAAADLRSPGDRRRARRLRRARARVHGQRRRGRLRLHRGLAAPRLRRSGDDRRGAAHLRRRRPAQRDDQDPGHAGECIPAVCECLCDGLNINITLLFSMSQYEAVAEAYRDALEDRLRHDLTIRATSSVASFFVSRVDTLVDACSTSSRRRRRRRAAAPRGPQGQGRRRQLQARLRALSQLSERARLAAHRRLRRQGPARSLGEHQHQEPGLPGHDVRRRAHRRAHGEHAARGHLAGVQRTRHAGAHRRPAPRRRAPRAARARPARHRHGGRRRAAAGRAASSCSSSRSTA